MYNSQAIGRVEVIIFGHFVLLILTGMLFINNGGLSNKARWENSKRGGVTKRYRLFLCVRLQVQMDS